MSVLPVTAFLALLLLCVPCADAFGDTFTVNCQPLTTQRSDPIVSPGVASGHVHAVVGGNAFSRNMSGIYAANLANITTCDKLLDHSDYWVPQLYHGRSDGLFELVPFKGSAIYYQVRACNYTTSATVCDPTVVPLAFPYGFRMLAGDTTRRTQNNSDPAQRAVNMMCLREDTSAQYQGFPPTTCLTLRAEVYFPSCWDGVNLDSPDHKSHVAYPAVGDFDGGICPESHPVALLSIFYEFFFDTSSYNDSNRFVFANGDTTGYGFHGDFIMGWTDREALQTAHETCTDPPTVCPIQNEGLAASKQALLYPAIYEEDIGLHNPIAKLPGNNPVNFTANLPPRAKISTLGGAFLVSPGPASPLTATGTLATASIFDVVTQQGLTTLRNEADGQYVSADAGGAAPLIANRADPQGWETFVLNQLADGSFTITAEDNGNFVATQGDGTLVASVAASAGAGADCEFIFKWQ